MTLVLRRPEDGTSVELVERPLCIGQAESADVRVLGKGVEAAHILVSATHVEALADCEVGGVLLRRGARRRVVPSTIELGEAKVEIAFAEHSDVATRELVLRAISPQARGAVRGLWPRVVVVEGPGVGCELDLREDGSFKVGRDPTCAITLADLELSREHLEIVRSEGQVLVRDLRSSGGSWIGRVRLESGRKAVWPAHRMVRVGTTVLALVEPLPMLKTAPSAQAPAPAPFASRGDGWSAVETEQVATTSPLPSPAEASDGVPLAAAPVAMVGPDLPPADPGRSRKDVTRTRLEVAVVAALVAIIIAALATIVYVLAAGR